LGVWDMAHGDTRWLLDDPGRNLEGAYVPHGSEQAVVVEIKEARVIPSLLDLNTGRETHLPAVAGNLLPIAPVGNGDGLGLYWSSTQPGDVVRFSPDDLRPE